MKLKTVSEFKVNPKLTWAYALFSGLTLFYVLYVFEGFGIEQDISLSGHNLLERSLLFGMINGVTIGVLESIFNRSILIRTPGQYAFWTSLELLVGATSIFLLYNYFWLWQEWYWESYFLLILEYFSVMIVPVLVKTFFILFLSRKSTKSSLLAFKSENGKDKIYLKPSQFLFLKSVGNYIEVYSLGDKGPENHLVRNTLKYFEEEYSGNPFLVRCHRSYLVNPDQIKKVFTIKGKSELDMGVESIPLSDLYKDNFKF